MDQGLITNPKDLEHMQHELDVARAPDLDARGRGAGGHGAARGRAARRSSEQAQRVAAADERLAELAVARDDKLAELEHELAEVAACARPAVEGMPDDLLALYDKLRANKGGVGAAALHQRRCTGCQLGLDNAEIGVIRAAARRPGRPL